MRPNEGPVGRAPRRTRSWLKSNQAPPGRPMPQVVALGEPWALTRLLEDLLINLRPRNYRAGSGGPGRALEAGEGADNEWPFQSALALAPSSPLGGAQPSHRATEPARTGPRGRRGRELAFPTKRRWAEKNKATNFSARPRAEPLPRSTGAPREPAASHSSSSIPIETAPLGAAAGDRGRRFDYTNRPGGSGLDSQKLIVILAARLFASERSPAHFWGRQTSFLRRRRRRRRPLFIVRRKPNEQSADDPAQRRRRRKNFLRFQHSQECD